MPENSTLKKRLFMDASKANEKSPSAEAYAGFVGLDWSSQEHVFCVYDVQSAKRSTHTIAQDPDALIQFLSELRARFGGRPILLGLEATRASIVPVLLQHEFLRLILINPHSAKSFRQMFRPSGAKNDQLDAYYICEMVRNHSHEFRIWLPHDPLTRQLAASAEKCRALVDLRAQVANSLHSALACSFPQILDLLGCSMTIPIAADFLNRWPNMAAAKKAGINRLRAFFYKHNMRATDTLEQRLKTFVASQPLLTCKADIAPVSFYIRALAQQLQPLHKSIQGFDAEIAKLLHEHPSARLFAEVPGVGPKLCPRLVAAFGTQKERFSSAQEICTYTGIAPVQRSSGNSSITVARHIRPMFLHQTFVEHANCSIRSCVWGKEFYNLKREGGKGHYAAIRALAAKWIRIFYACWSKGVPYNEQIYLESLRRAGGELWNRIQKINPDSSVNNSASPA
jgi:transposase